MGVSVYRQSLTGVVILDQNSKARKQRPTNRYGRCTVEEEAPRLFREQGPLGSGFVTARSHEGVLAPQTGQILACQERLCLPKTGLQYWATENEGGAFAHTLVGLSSDNLGVSRR